MDEGRQRWEKFNHREIISRPLYTLRVQSDHQHKDNTMPHPKDTKTPGSLPGGRNVNDFVYDPSYAEAPQDTRFKPGQSGNPGGRPPGSKNKPKVLNDVLYTDMMHEEYSRPVEANDGDQIESIPIIRSIMRKRYGPCAFA
jgi:Family of unknown function (DUF5681)